MDLHTTEKLAQGLLMIIPASVSPGVDVEIVLE